MECLQGAFEAYKVNIFMSSGGGKELSSPQPNTKMDYLEKCSISTCCFVLAGRSDVGTNGQDFRSSVGLLASLP